MDLRVQFPDPRSYERLADWALELNAVLTRMLQQTPENQYPIIGLADVKPAGTPGGASIAGWNPRMLNTEYDPMGICLLNVDGTFVLPKGRYMVQASVPGYSVNQHQAYLEDMSNSLIAISGTSEYAPTGSSQTRSWIMGVIQPKDATKYIINHFCTIATAGNGLGVAVGATGQDVYTQVAIWGLQ